MPKDGGIVQLMNIKWPFVPKWQFMSYESAGEIKHYKLLRTFGARLHLRAEWLGFQYRLAYFVLGIQIHPLQIGPHIKIYIPFMKHDKGLIIKVFQEERVHET